jgi:putative peptidoglycan lipid II flippase
VTAARGLAASVLRPVQLDRQSQVSLAQGGALSTTGLLAQGFLRFATAWLVGRLAGPEAFGVVATAIATATLLALLWPTTTGSAASKYVARARGAGNTPEMLSTARHLAVRTVQASLLLGAASIPVWVLVDHGTVAGALCVAAMTIAYSGYSFTRGVQFGAGQVPRATAWDLISVAVGLGALAALLLAGVRGPALVLPLALGYGVYALAGWPHGVRGRPDSAHRRELDAFVALGAAGSVASTGFLQLSQITARLTAGVHDAGQYAAALNLATPASMLAASLSLVLFPSLAEAWGRGDHATFRAQTDRATRALAAVMVGIFGSLILCSRFLVALVWGEQYAEAATVLPVLVLAVLATNLAVASVNALTTTSRKGMRVTTTASLLGLAVGVVVWLVLGDRLGILGVAIGYLAGTLVIAAIPVTIVWRRDHHRWAGLFLRVLAALLVVGATALGQRAAELPLWLEPVLAVVFLAAWVLVSRRDLPRLPGLSTTRGRRRSP